MPDESVLIYLVRRDLRVSDNPIFHTLGTDNSHGFSYLLPLYIFNAQQLEVKGFIPEGSDCVSPYKEARSTVSKFWRCGPHRATFLAESVWDLKESLEKLGSGLCIRAGSTADIIKALLNSKEKFNVKAIWMTGEEGLEENTEESLVKDICRAADIDFKLWNVEKYLIDDRDLALTNIDELSDVFTTYRKTVEPLRNQARPVLPTSKKSSLPKFPPASSIPAQPAPFIIPDSLPSLINSLLAPLKAQPMAKDPLPYPENTPSSHPFRGGESQAHSRLTYFLASNSIATYHITRNGLVGLDYSTKLSGYLALGCITARQIHGLLVAFEDGTDPSYSTVPGFGAGENDGTKSIRFELLWRDYMRLCTRKFGPALFHLSGFKARPEDEDRWSSPSRLSREETRSTAEIVEIVERFCNGTTGMGLIDASLRELYHTGYTSNRARQNVASFLAKHMKIDWRIGAEWYECMLVDYDLSSNWGNWQYLAGVGCDPRGEARIFNPVKQAFDYDPSGEYIKAWVPELRGLTEPSEIYQAWTVTEERREKLGLDTLNWVKNPLLKIEFTVGKRGRHLGRQKSSSDRGGRGGKPIAGPSGSFGSGGDFNSRGGDSKGMGRGGYGGRGYGSPRGHFRGYGRGRGSTGGRGEFRGTFGNRAHGGDAGAQFPATQYPPSR